jgi:hypothetical protein
MPLEGQRIPKCWTASRTSDMRLLDSRTATPCLVRLPSRICGFA